MGTHDFIKFPPHGPQPTARFYGLIGEIQTLLAQIKRIPIPPSIRDDLLTVYLAKSVQGTTAIEGNQLGEAAVLDMVKATPNAKPPGDYQEQEVRNAIDSINAVAQASLEGRDTQLSLQLLNLYHRMVIADTGSPNCDSEDIGAVRRMSVTVGRYLAPSAEECPRLLRQFCDWLNQSEAPPAGQERYRLAWGVVRAIIAHVYFAWIHPYCDGNGRLSRLLEFKIILDAGAPLIAALLLSNMYNKRRMQYYSELQASHGDFYDGAYPAEANVHDFVIFALAGFRDELEAQRNEIYNSQITVIWHNLIHSRFPKKLSDAQQRRKQLALDLTQPRFLQPVPFRDMREISPAIAVAYVNDSDATLRNDLRVLIDMDLVLRTDEGYKPNTDILFGLVHGFGDDE